MTAAALLRSLWVRGVQLRASGNRIAFWPADLDADTLALIRTHKAHLLGVLEQREQAEDEALLAALARLDAVDRELAQTTRTCRACHGTDFWSSLYVAHICRRCHPPAPDAEVADA